MLTVRISREQLVTIKMSNWENRKEICPSISIIQLIRDNPSDTQKLFAYLQLLQTTRNHKWLPTQNQIIKIENRIDMGHRGNKILVI